jgi:protein glucosyltransferase
MKVQNQDGFVFHVRSNRFHISEVSGRPTFINSVHAAIKTGKLPSILPLFLKAALCFGLPDFDGVIHGDDWPVSTLSTGAFPVFSWDKAFSYTFDILIPWLQFSTSLKNIKQNEIPPWNKKQDRAFFRGATTGGDYNATNYRTFPRAKIVYFCKNRPDLCDAKFTSIVHADKPARGALLHAFGTAPFVNIYQEAHYKYIILPDGNGAPASRSGKYFFTRSVILKPETEFQEFYYGNLRPWVHYVPLSSTLDDLESKLVWLRQNDKRAQRIADNAYAYGVRYLNDYHISCYMVDLATTFRSLFQDEPLMDVSALSWIKIQSYDLVHEKHVRDDTFKQCPLVHI